MNLNEEIKKIEEIKIGFDISLAEIKIDKIIELVKFIEENFDQDFKRIKRDELVAVLQQVYGISYEIGNTKQSLSSGKDVILAKRILPIARKVYNKSKELLPYLHLNLTNYIGKEIQHKLLLEEINEIEKLSR